LPHQGNLRRGQAVGLIGEVAEGALQFEGFGGEGAGGGNGSGVFVPLVPTSNLPWLSIAGIANGTVSFAFSATTSNRTANITLLGQPIAITQAAVLPPALIGPPVLSNGTFQFAFSNNDLGASFTVLTTTNLSLPLSNWTVAGPATNTAPGLFQFSTDTINNPQGFYRIRSP